MSKCTKCQYYMIDILKYIFSIGIVMLHTGFLKDIDSYGYWIEKGLVRIGVPFFFMASGFMLERKVNWGGVERKQIFLNWSKRLFLRLIVFEVINIILDSVNYVFIGKDIIKILLRHIRSVIFYPKGALWYIQACLVGIWIIYFFFKKKKQKWIIPVGIMLYIFALICNNYNFLVCDTEIGKMIDFLLLIIYSVRNGLFYGFFFIYLGMCAFRIRCWLDNKRYGNVFLAMLTIFVYFVFLSEISYLQNKEAKDDGSLFIFLPLLTILLLILATHFITTNRTTVLLRNLSTGIYLLHYPVLGFFKIIMNIYHAEIESIYVFFAVIISVHIICLKAYSRNGKISQLLK